MSLGPEKMQGRQGRDFTARGSGADCSGSARVRQSSSAVGQRQRISRFPVWSTWKRIPGGTTVVALYSKTTAGPA